jgi:hypothetical protein
VLLLSKNLAIDYNLAVELMHELIDVSPTEGNWKYFCRGYYTFHDPHVPTMASSFGHLSKLL